MNARKEMRVSESEWRRESMMRRPQAPMRTRTKKSLLERIWSWMN